MVQWRDRHLGYKIGFCGLVVCIVAYVIGFSVPYWSLLRLRRYGYMDQTIGLWQTCVHETLTCASNVHGANPAWINAARAMSSLTVILYAVVLVTGCYRNCSRFGQRNSNSLGRHIECLSIIATLIGFVGCIIFGTQFNRVYTRQNSLGHLYWAFGLVCAALSIASICGGLMFFFNRSQYIRRRPTATLRMRGPNGLPVSVQFPAQNGDELLHIPYFGDVTVDQLMYGATPMQPPSYDMVTQGVNYTTPPADAADAPPLYEDISKDSALPPEVMQQSQNQHKTDEENGSENPE